VTTAFLVLLLAAAVLGLAGARLMLRHRHRMHAERPVSLVKAGIVAQHPRSATSRAVGIGEPHMQPYMQTPNIQTSHIQTSHIQTSHIQTEN
jgi:hypothetical protein